MKKKSLLILLSIFILSCNTEDDNFEIANVESALIAKGNLYGNGEEGIIQQNIVISNQNSWSDLITQMDSSNNVSDSFLETNIDFSQYRIIAIFDEIKDNGGYLLELSINSNLDNIIVSIINDSQGDTSNVITQPFHIVKIQKSNLPIVFE
jgi:hypothetical protein